MLKIRKRRRTFLPKDLEIKSWKDLKPYTDELIRRPINSMRDYKKYIRNLDEVWFVLEEKSCRKAMAHQLDTRDKKKKKDYDDFQIKVMNSTFSFFERSNKKLYTSPYKDKITDPGLKRYIATVKRRSKLAERKNSTLASADVDYTERYDDLTSQMRPIINGKKIQFSDCEDRYCNKDRSVRQEAWEAMQACYAKESVKIDFIFDKLVKARNKVARNAGFETYVDYAFEDLNRVDYTPEDCAAFREAVRKAALPFARQQSRKHKKELGVKTYRYWDRWTGKKQCDAAKPFENHHELMEKLPTLFYGYDVSFGDLVAHHRDAGLYDLGSRKNKTDGSWTMYYPESCTSIIVDSMGFTTDDLVTAVHESTHAIHAHLCKDLPYDFLIDTPNEVSELFTSAMELISQNSWDQFYKNKKDCTQARHNFMKERISGLLTTCQIDEFQHEVYTKPEMTKRQRHAKWNRLDIKYKDGMYDWSGYETARRKNWHQHTHIFNLPLYYIEYGFAQIGAFQIYRNYQQNPSKTIKQLKNAMKMGNTASVPEIYKAAGANFDFNEKTIQDALGFAMQEVDILERCMKTGRDPDTLRRKNGAYERFAPTTRLVA